MSATPQVRVGDRAVGPGHAVYVVAELSANHHGDLSRAIAIVEAAAAAGADAVKLQTYTAESLTLDLDRPPFVVEGGSVWDGRSLHSIYKEAALPWDWHVPIAARASELGLQLFSSPFDKRAVDFLVELGVPALKIASPELVDVPLIDYAASSGLPVIMSTGMASVAEIDEAVATARRAGNGGVVLLRCSSSYPARPDEMDLRTIPDMASRWEVPIGLSDHTLGAATAVTAVALGACMIERHLTISRADPGPDSAFSLEPDEFAGLVSSIRESEQALGTVRYGPTASEQVVLANRRSLFAVADIAAGETITEDNVRSIRPAAGLPPRELPRLIGRKARRAIARGTPLSADLLE